MVLQTKGDDNIYIYTHKTFDIAYNGDRVRRGWAGPAPNPEPAARPSQQLWQGGSLGSGLPAAMRVTGLRTWWCEGQ